MWQVVHLSKLRDVLHELLHHLGHVKHIHWVCEPCCLQGIRPHLMCHRHGIGGIDWPLKYRYTKTFVRRQANHNRATAENSGDLSEWYWPGWRYEAHGWCHWCSDSLCSHLPAISQHGHSSGRPFSAPYLPLGAGRGSATAGSIGGTWCLPGFSATWYS